MKSALRWPIGISLVLASVVALNIWVAIKAGSDQSFAIEPDYYRKAVAWDSAMAQDRANLKLRWHITAVLSPVIHDTATLRASITDASGVPVSGADVRVTAMFNARANEAVSMRLAPAASDSAYEAVLAVAHRGVWELRFLVTRGDERFTINTRVEALAASAP
jgi:hypothetical protein